MKVGTALTIPKIACNSTRKNSIQNGVISTKNVSENQSFNFSQM